MFPIAVPVEGETREKMVKFCVKTSTGTKVDLDFSDTTTVDAVKNALVEKTGIAVAQQRLIYAGKVPGLDFILFISFFLLLKIKKST